MTKQKNYVSIYSIDKSLLSDTDAKLYEQTIRIWETLAEMGGFDKNKKIYINPDGAKPLSDKELMKELIEPLPPIG